MRTIDFFDRGAMWHPDRPCLVDDTISISYRQARQASNAIARALRRLGVAAGDGVAVLCPNDAWGYVACLGVMRADAAWVPLNIRNTVADNARHMDIGQAHTLLYHSSLAADIDAYRQGVPGLRQVVCIDRVEGANPSLRDLAAAEDGGPFPPAPWRMDRDQVFRVSCTGGTTGIPKGVRHNHLSYEINTAAYLALWHFDEPPTFLLTAPMTHAGGALAPPVFALGGTVRMLAKADPLRIMQVMQDERVHATMLPPTVLYMMLDHPQVRDFDYSALRYLYFAAAPMAADKIRRAIDIFGPVMAQFFGQTEVATTITHMSPQEYAEAASDPAKEHRLRSAGRPGPFTVAAIMGEDGALLPDGEVGEIVVRSNQVMSGYIDAEEATAAVFAHGWHHTGDLGYRDGDGYYYLVDRKRDLVISGGFNVYPGEVERIVLGHPAVQDCAVIGVPDDKWGEALTAVVQPVPGATATEEEIRSWCRERLSGVMCPKHVLFRDELPRSPVGKVLKRVIRDEFWKGRDRAI